MTRSYPESALRPVIAPQLRASEPSIARLRTIALSLLRTTRTRMLGLEIDDLISAGWIGYMDAVPAAEYQSYCYERARFAMLDELRRWYGVQRTGRAWERPEFLRTPRASHLEVSNPRGIHSDVPGYRATLADVREALGYVRSRTAPRLTEEQAADLRAFCARHLSVRSAEIIVGLLVDEDSLELIAERQGRSRQAAAIARSQAIRALTRALAA